MRCWFSCHVGYEIAPSSDPASPAHLPPKGKAKFYRKVRMPSTVATRRVPSIDASRPEDGTHREPGAVWAAGQSQAVEPHPSKSVQTREGEREGRNLVWYGNMVYKISEDMVYKRT